MTELEKQQKRLDCVIAQLRENLRTASDIAHLIKQAEFDGQEPEYQDFDAATELGYLVRFAGDLCGANLLVMSRLALELAEVAHDDSDRPRSQRKTKDNVVNITDNIA